MTTAEAREATAEARRAYERAPNSYTYGFDDIIAKRVELLCQLVTKIAYLSGGPFWLAFRDERPFVIAAADRLNRQLIEVECPSKDALGESFATMIERGAGAVTINAIPLFNNNVDEIVRLAERHKIPAMCHRSAHARNAAEIRWGRSEKIAAVVPEDGEDVRF
jgi:hypothetical protein